MDSKKLFGLLFSTNVSILTDFQVLENFRSQWHNIPFYTFRYINVYPYSIFNAFMIVFEWELLRLDTQNFSFQTMYHKVSFCTFRYINIHIKR